MQRRDLVLFMVGFLISRSLGSFKDYTGYKIFRVQLTSASQYQLVRAANCELQKPTLSLAQPVEVICSPEASLPFLQAANSSGLTVTTLVADLGQLVQAQMTGQGAENASKGRRSTRNRSIDFTNYQSYDSIVSWVEGLATTYPSFVSLIDMGRSFENRKLLALKIGNSPSGVNTRAIWIDGGIHAREWIAPATATFIIDQLVKAFQSKNNTSSIKRVDWYVAPLINPDGYDYSQKSDRLWRKNRRSAPSGSSCMGVDLNRNWNVTGYGIGASKNPCSDTYQGSSPNSEPEVQAVQKTILSLSRNIRIYITLHSYGQLWLTSWGYTSKLPADIGKITALGKLGAAAIKSVNSLRTYTVEIGAKLYPCGGASDDWSKIVAQIPYSYTVELPDTGDVGFLLPPSNIVPVGNEIWAAMAPMSVGAEKEPLGKKNSSKKTTKTPNHG